MKYPVAESFVSIQGEGKYTGTLMLFVRLAGCNVGEVGKGENGMPLCTLHDGRTFTCDTDYKKKEEWTIEDFIGEIRKADVYHFCLTGGEPHIHDLSPLVNEILYSDKQLKIHIETSGTKPIPADIAMNPKVWISCSPKKNFLDKSIREAREIKFLVDEHFDYEIAAKLERTIDWVWGDVKFYLQPVNHVNKLNMKNVQRCIDIQREQPSWRLSLQMHKILGVR